MRLVAMIRRQLRNSRSGRRHPLATRLKPLRLSQADRSQTSSTPSFTSLLIGPCLQGVLGLASRQINLVQDNTPFQEAFMVRIHVCLHLDAFPRLLPNAPVWAVNSKVLNEASALVWCQFILSC